MKLSPKQKQQLKAQAHHLNPIVYLGSQGFTESVKKEIERALDDHELIKIKIQENDRTLRKSLLTEICQATMSQAVQAIGKIGILYRKSKK